MAKATTTIESSLEHTDNQQDEREYGQCSRERTNHGPPNHKQIL